MQVEIMEKVKPQFVYDDSGNKTFVLLTIEDWKKVAPDKNNNDEFTEFENNLRTALKEADDFIKGEKKLKPLSEMIDEL